MLKPATTIVVIVTMIGALRVFDIVSIMTAGGPANATNVLALYMYQETFQNFRYGFGAAIAVLLVTIFGATLTPTMFVTIVAVLFVVPILVDLPWQERHGAGWSSVGWYVGIR